MNYIKSCEKVFKTSIYLLVFLLPIFFLPWTSDVLDFNKQFLLIFLVFISFFAWMLKILISGKFKFTFTSVHIPLIVLFFVLLFSTLFSFYPYGSFWGWPQSTGESFLTFLCFVLFYFLIINIFEKQEVFRLIIYLLFSSFLAMLFGIFQLFNKFLLPFAFSKTSSFNTIGSTGSLAVLAAGLLPLLILLFIKTNKKLLKVFFAASIILSALVLILVNFHIAWWLVILGAVLVITLMAQKRDVIDNRWLILPMFFLAAALLFIFLKIQIPGLANRSIEVFLNQRASFDIAWKTLKEYPVLGTGQGSFIFDFAKHKSPNFNKSQLWNIRFGKAGSEFFNALATTGILGGLSLLALIGLFIFYGVKVLFIEQKKKRKQATIKAKEKGKGKESASTSVKTGAEDGVKNFFWVLSAGIFISFLVFTAGYFLYNSNLSLKFVYFLFLAAFIALNFPKKEFFLKPSSLPTLIFTFVFTLFFVFGLGVFILEVQRCVAAVDYQKGVNAWRQNNSEQAVEYVKKATRINPKVDLYWRQLSQLYIQRITEMVRDGKISKDEFNKRLQIYMNNAINSAKAAVDTNSKNVANWSNRAFVYQKLIGVINGTEDWAIKSYESALRLEPLNPYFPTQEGIIYVHQALRLPESGKDEKLELLEKAKVQFEKAIDLKSDYAPANFQLAMVYQYEGKQKEAIKRLEATRRIAPRDVGLAFQLGLTYYQNKDYEKARGEFERAVILNPNYSNALYFLGLVYNRLGLNNKALEQFERVADLNPDNKQVKKIIDNLKSGRNIMEGLVEKKPPEVPIKEKEKEE